MQGERDVFWAERRSVIAFGVLTVAFWLSRVVFPDPLPPLAPMPDFVRIAEEVKSAAPWIQQEVGVDAPADDLQRSLRRDYVREIAVVWAEIGLGATSGVLIARRRRAGRWLAIALCAVTLASLLSLQVRLGRQGRFTEFWRAYAVSSPRLVVYRVVVLVFCAGALAYLTRRRVGTQFSAGSPHDALTHGSPRP